MSVADEIEKLHRLHQDGALNVEEFAAAKAKLLAGDSTPPMLAATGLLRRSRSDRWLGGVCGGIAKVSGIESWVWRLLWVVMACFAGVGILAYILCWIFVPDEDNTG
ncbi:MAG: PspC domain-containing protein [Betaproteobacteria bacterium]|nr:PspC domain-containing protein [Betaproteobacteria bacterium]